MLKKNGRLGWGASALFVLSMMCAATPGQAQIQSLKDALTSSYTSNPTLLAQRAQLRATDELVAQAFGGWQPTITIDASRPIAGEETTRGGVTTNQILAITAQQSVFRGLRTPNEIREARDRVRAGRALLRRTEQDILLRTVEAYTDVLRDTAIVGAGRSSVEGIQRQLNAAKSRRQRGRATRTDVAQSEARLSRAQSDLTTAEAQLARSRAIFAEIIGQVAAGNLSTPPALPLLPSGEQDAVERARLNSPLVQQAKFEEEAAQHAYQVARGALLPQLSLEAQYLSQDVERDPVISGGEILDPGGEETVDTSGVTARLSVPLYQSGQAYSQIRETRHEASESRLLRMRAEREAGRLATEAWENLRSARDRIVSSREEVRANKVALNGVRREAQVGSRTTLDVLDAEEELRDAQIALARAGRDEYVAAFELLAAVGDLTVETIGLPVQVYDPETGE